MGPRDGERRVLRWRPLEGDGLEHLEIARGEAGYHVRSVVIGATEEERFGLRYEIDLARDWTTRRVRVERMDGLQLGLLADGLGTWTDGAGLPLPSLTGCIDVDLFGTPFTNTLPLRRAELVRGVPRRFEMAWIDPGKMNVVRDGQIYTALGGDHYRFQSADGSFEAELAVDADRFVTYYPTLFQRTD